MSHYSYPLSVQSKRMSVFLWLILPAMLLAGCAQAMETLAPSPSATLTLSLTTTNTSTPSPIPPTATPTPPVVYSPLQGFDRSDLVAAVAVPFDPPAAGMDDPHHGVDLAQMDANQVAVAGLPIQAVLGGTVAMVTDDRFPYGNAILIETPLDEALARELQSLSIPTPAPTLPLVSALTCPEPTVEPVWDESQRSLYLLYAHMEAAPAFESGQTVAGGAVLGAISSSGNALNPHLHLEVRAGPAGVRFTSMAHYDDSATVEEMSNYCLWRVRGVFQMLDPMTLLGLVEDD